jgi:hypothetical protein
LAVYPTPAEAAKAASAATRSSSVINGRVVLSLDPSLVAYRTQYLAAIAAPTAASQPKATTEP